MVLNSVSFLFFVASYQQKIKYSYIFISIRYSITTVRLQYDWRHILYIW